MLEAGRITYKQLISLIVLSRIIITITYLPALKEPPANQDIWLSELLFFPLQLLFVLPIYLLWRRFPDQTIIQYSQIIAGKLGKLIGFLFIGYFLQSAVITLSQFGLFFTSTIMPETPILFFYMTLILICAYSTLKGLEVICRLSEFFAPIVLIAITTVSLFLIKDMHLKELTPVMEKGILPVFQGGIIYSARTVEILGLAMLLPYLNNRQKVKTIFIISFALVTLFFLIITLPVITVFRLEERIALNFPFYSLIRLVDVADFLERVESVHMAIWILGIFVKVSFLYYLTVLGLSQLLKLSDYKPLVLPIGSLIIPLSILIAPSLVELNEFTSYKVFTGYSLSFLFVLPCLLLLTAIIRKKGAGHQ
jgi:spore germination protein KB